MKKMTIMAFVAFSIVGQAQAITILSSGHIDLGLGYSSGVWDPHVHVHGGDEYETEEALLYYGTAAQALRPNGSAYNVIGVAAGAPIWRNYSSNQPNIPWLGFGFEEINQGTFGTFTQTDARRDPIDGEWIDVSLESFTAPVGGNVTFFQGGGASPTIWFATSDGIDSTDKFISTSGGHEHGSFVFTATGLYSLTFTASAIDKVTGNRITSAPYTYNFGVEAVPEPATMTALALGAAALLRRKKK